MLQPVIYRQDKEKCAFCDDFYMNGDEMHSHTRSMHPEELVKSKKRKWVESGIQTKVESVSWKKVWKKRAAWKTAWNEFMRMQEKCKYCDGFYSIGNGMTNHVRSMHPKELEKTRQQM